MRVALTVLRTRVMDAVPRTLLVLVAAALVAVAVWACGRGLDRVDESFVLAGVANPDASRAAGEVTFSGFVLHPLFAVTGGDVARYRMVGVVLIAVLSGRDHGPAHPVPRLAD